MEFGSVLRARSYHSLAYFLLLLDKIDMPDGEKGADHRWIEFGRMLQQLDGLGDAACAKSDAGTEEVTAGVPGIGRHQFLRHLASLFHLSGSQIEIAERPFRIKMRWIELPYTRESKIGSGAITSL